MAHLTAQCCLSSSGARIDIENGANKRLEQLIDETPSLLAALKQNRDSQVKKAKAQIELLTKENRELQIKLDDRDAKLEESKSTINRLRARESEVKDAQLAQCVAIFNQAVTEVGLRFKMMKKASNTQPKRKRQGLLLAPDPDVDAHSKTDSKAKSTQVRVGDIPEDNDPAAGHSSETENSEPPQKKFKSSATSSTFPSNAPSIH